MYIENSESFVLGIFQNVITVNLNCDRHPYLFLFIQLCILIKKLIQMVYKKNLHIINENLDTGCILNSFIIKRLASFKKAVWLTNNLLEVCYILICTSMTILAFTYYLVKKIPCFFCRKSLNNVLIFKQSSTSQ